jgi:hypothetical protein
MARIPIEASCRITDPAGSEEFFLIASCKGEDVYVERGLFKDPSYDWCGIFSEEDYALLRTFATYEAGRAEERTIGRIADDFDDVRIGLRKLSGARALACGDGIVWATMGNRGLSGRTVIRDRAKEVMVVLEYPIKTVNVNQDRGRVSGRYRAGPVPRLGSPRRQEDRAALSSLHCIQRLRICGVPPPEPDARRPGAVGQALLRD